MSLPGIPPCLVLQRLKQRRRQSRVQWGLTLSGPALQDAAAAAPLSVLGQPGSPSPAVQAEDACVSVCLRSVALPKISSHVFKPTGSSVERSALDRQQHFPLPYPWVYTESCSQQKPRAWLTCTAMSYSHPGNCSYVTAQSQHGKLSNPKPSVAQEPCWDPCSGAMI